MMVSFVNIFKFLILKMKKIFVLYNAALLRCLPIMTCFKHRFRGVWRVLVSVAAVKCCSIPFRQNHDSTPFLSSRREFQMD